MERDEIMDFFSDLAVSDQPEANEEKSGVYTLSADEIEARALAQAKNQKLGNDLMEVTGAMLADLGSEFDPIKIRTVLSVFNHEVSAILVANGISNKSNLVILLEGLRQEFEIVITDGHRFPETATKTKLKVLSRALGDLQVAFATLKAEGDWDVFEQYVPNVIGIGAFDNADIGELQVALGVSRTKEEAMDVLNSIETRKVDPDSIKAEKLRLFGEGHKSIGQFQYENESWADAKKAARRFKPVQAVNPVAEAAE